MSHGAENREGEDIWKEEEICVERANKRRKQAEGEGDVEVQKKVLY